MTNNKSINRIEFTGYQTWNYVPVEVTPEIAARFRAEVKSKVASAKMSDYSICDEGWVHDGAALFGRVSVGRGAVISAGALIGDAANIVANAHIKRGRLVEAGSTQA